VGSITTARGGGALGTAGFIPDQGAFDPDVLRNNLAMLRNEVPCDPTVAPAGVTDVRIERVFITNGYSVIQIKP